MIFFYLILIFFKSILTSVVVAPALNINYIGSLQKLKKFKRLQLVSSFKSAMQSIRDEINELKGFGFSEADARELVMIERRKNSEKPMTSVKANVGFSPPTPLVKSNNSIVNSSNVLVPTNKITKLFLTAAEKNQKIESYEIEIVLQNPKIWIKKRGSYQIETEVKNDVFTVLEHPMKKKEKTETLIKKETIYESHVRAGLIKTIEVTLPESGNAQFVPRISFI